MIRSRNDRRREPTLSARDRARLEITARANERAALKRIAERLAEQSRDAKDKERG